MSKASDVFDAFEHYVHKDLSRKFRHHVGLQSTIRRLKVGYVGQIRVTLVEDEEGRVEASIALAIGTPSHYHVARVCEALRIPTPRETTCSTRSKMIVWAIDTGEDQCQPEP